MILFFLFPGPVIPQVKKSNRGTRMTLYPPQAKSRRTFKFDYLVYPEAYARPSPKYYYANVV